MMSHVHLINLDRSSDRLMTFNRRNSHLKTVLRFPAIDGSLLDRQELIRNGIILEDCPYSSGTLGCALSHIELWRKALTENCPITIFEDDVIAAFEFEEKMARILEKIPADWDVVNWGYLFGGPLKVWLDLSFSKVMIDFYAPKKFGECIDFQSTEYDYSIFRLLNSWGLQSYSVSPKGARMLLDHCLPLRKQAIQFSQDGVSYLDEGIDGPMNGVYRSMQAFICVPPLVMHEPPQELLSDRIATDREF